MNPERSAPIHHDDHDPTRNESGNDFANELASSPPPARRCELTEQLQLRTGSIRDYAQLSEHHYRAARPATIARVLALEHRQPTAVGRYLARPEQRAVVGVLVQSMPTLCCRMRGWALHDRYGTYLTAAQRAQLINQELRCISRVVVHPQWRGLGLAVRLVKAALAQPATIFTEAMAAMGQINPFLERAGMTAYPRPPHAFDARLIAALQNAGFSASDLSMLDQLLTRIDALAPSRRMWLLNELYRWYRHTAGRPKAHCTETREHLRHARDRLLLAPVYYLSDHRAHTRVHHDATSTDRPVATSCTPRQQQRDAPRSTDEAGGPPQTHGSISAPDRAAAAEQHSPSAAAIPNH